MGKVVSKEASQEASEEESEEVSKEESSAGERGGEQRTFVAGLARVERGQVAQHLSSTSETAGARILM